MKTIRWVFLLALTACPSTNSAQQAPAQFGSKTCWIVDVSINSSGEVDYVDGMRVPDDLEFGGGTVVYLRQQERKTTPRTCMISFVTDLARIEHVNTLRAIAGKIGYDESSVYLHEEHNREAVREILWTQQVSARTVRKGCRTVELATTKTGEVDYVDGARVPGESTLIDDLRGKQKSSMRSCMLVLVTARTKIRAIEDLRRRAGEMQYSEFHAYVRDSQDPDTVTEFLYGPPRNPNELRASPHGLIPWPERAPEKR